MGTDLGTFSNSPPDPLSNTGKDVRERHRYNDATKRFIDMTKCQILTWPKSCETVRDP